MRALVALMTSGGVFAVAACHDALLAPKDSRFRIQLDVSSIRPELSAVLETVELTTSEGSAQQSDSLPWDAVVQGTPFNVRLSKAGKVRFDAAALAGTTRPDGGVALLRGSTEAVVKDGFKVYVYLEDLTPNLTLSPEQTPTPCNTALNFVMQRSATIRICNQGVGLLTWTGGGGSVVGSQAGSCPAGRHVCVALDPAGGEIPPGGEKLVELRALGDSSGVVPIVFEEIFKGLLLSTDTALVTVQEPAISLEVQTDPANTDETPGPSLESGTGLSVSYRVANSGAIPLQDVLVTEADTLPTTERVDTVFKLAGLEPGQVFDTTLIRPVYGGKQARRIEAQGTFEPGGAVTDSVTRYYVGLVPGVDLETLTNGAEDDTFPGPPVSVGSQVEIEFWIRNVGEVPLDQLTLTDTTGAAVAVTCGGDGGLPSALGAGSSVLCTLGLVAEPGPFRQQYTVTGTTPAGQHMADADSSHYMGREAPLSIEVRTNGVHADQPPGPSIVVGSPITWSYKVVNNLSETVTNLVVTDSVQGGVCAVTSLAAADTLTCTAYGVSESGQDASAATVTGQALGQALTASDRTYYFGVENAGIHVQMLTQGEDANDPPGPEIVVGGDVYWEYRVTNTGDVPLSDVRVTDDHRGLVCSAGTLYPGDGRTCNVTGTATLGQHSELATAEGTSPSGLVVSDTDPTHYLGVTDSTTESVSIDGARKGQGADRPAAGSSEAAPSVTRSFPVIKRPGPTTTVAPALPMRIHR